MAPQGKFDGPLLGGRWRIGPPLGKGAQAETFLARDEQATGAAAREVVVKRITPRGTWKSFDLFEREAKVLSQLRHPGVPRHIASFEEPPGTFNLIMERMPGDDLRAFAKKQRLGNIELIDILTRTLEILDHLHGRTPPVVHRDIKPSNLVRGPEGSIALVDFGGVLEAARESGGSTIVGTFGYMAPEQLHGEATPATDLYALGATIVALAGGIEPEDVPRRGLRMDLEKHLKSIDPGLRAALVAMTEPEPDKRPQRARDVLKLLASKKARALAVRPTAAAARRERGRTRTLGRLFPDVPEPIGTLLRLVVLAFGAGGWLGMLFVRFYLAILVGVFAIVAFPARKKLTSIGGELDLMLKEGQGGFGDIARRAIARAHPALPPGE